MPPKRRATRAAAKAKEAEPTTEAETTVEQPPGMSVFLFRSIWVRVLTFMKSEED